MAQKDAESSASTPRTGPMPEEGAESEDKDVKDLAGNTWLMDEKTQKSFNSWMTCRNGHKLNPNRRMAQSRVL